MNTLVIVESPSKAKTIEKYLASASTNSADKFTVRASVGHVRDLPKSNKLAIDIPAGFVPHYEISRGKEKVIHELQNLAEKADNIILATDPDREGEAIAWHLETLLKENKKVKTKDIKRAAFHEITKEAVTEALKHPRPIDTNLREAQEARRVLDRLVGYDLSGIIWKKVRYGLSAGRVQSPALRIIMEKEREIRSFIPETYFVLEADVKTKSNDTMTATCSIEPDNITEAERINKFANEKNWKVVDITEKTEKRSPKAPFTTSTLQQTASSRLGLSPSRTMQIAQKLYEAGHISYMRTDSTNLSIEALNQIVKTIEKDFGKEMVLTRVYKTKSKNAQEAHEAIRPTHPEIKSAGLNDQEKKLYELIRARTISSQMVDATMSRNRIDVLPISAVDVPVYKVNGSRVISPGWLLADPAAKSEDVVLPKLNISDTLNLIEARMIEKQTQPPSRYTEAGLIKELEARGIGRPSTYASIMSTLEDRGYVTKEGRTLTPTDTGDVVSSFLEEHFKEYISDTFTAEMEDKLDDIANGIRKYKETLEEFYTPFLKDVKIKDKLEKATTMETAPDDILCPVCNKNMVVKLARTGKFYSCALYPECMGARKIDGSIMEGPKDIGRACPKCGIPVVEVEILNKDGSVRKSRKKKVVELGKLVIREGRFGNFISCSRYPKCKYIEEDEEERKKRDSGIACPLCKTGNMTERKGRFGIFYSCTNYPTCKNAIKSKPTGNICPMCNSLMMDGTKTIPERCSNSKCQNHRPDKLIKSSS
ncbi:DNA topoisomerase I [Candidatus Nomurabacteria bacterium RIFCSPHIGHO2_02_FULL_33_12]|nr:MAG: DNA topoisomerase I [Candidatus Nomurabacteria bacterium RIFCSPHIGHO2_02_FULL_33_12]